MRRVRRAERIEDMDKSRDRAERAKEGGERDEQRGGGDRSWRMAEWKVLREKSVQRGGDEQRD